MIAICRKEIADYFTSVRFLILFSLALVTSGLAIYAAYLGIRGAGSGGFVFLRLFTTDIPGVPFSFLLSFVNFVALFFIPLIGIALGFDAINREHSDATLSRILSQPVYRDSVINGKFLAAIFTLAIMMTAATLLVSGAGLRMIGVPPTAEEVIRLFIYLIFTIIYGAFWISLAILFSILFRGVGTSLLSSIALWIFFSFVMYVIALAVRENPEASLIVLRISPSWLSARATTALLYPTIRTMGTLDISQAAFMEFNPLSLKQSILLIWPYLTSLVGLSALCFAVSYILFMRQEIRAT